VIKITFYQIPFNNKALEIITICAMTMRMVISNNNDHKLLFSNMLLRIIMTVKKSPCIFMVLR